MLKKIMNWITIEQFKFMTKEEVKAKISEINAKIKVLHKDIKELKEDVSNTLDFAVSIGKEIKANEKKVNKL